MSLLALKITGKAFDADVSLLRKYIEVLKGLLSTYKLVVVTGGGSSARNYINIARTLGVKSNYWLDQIGILVSRLNSFLLISALSEYSYPKPPTNVEEVIEAIKCHKLVVMGGIAPGQSTASVLLQVAEALGVKKTYYYSAIGRVYDKDPFKYADAQPLPTITASKLLAIIEQKALPGEYALIDSNALRIALRSGIEVQVLDYRVPEQIYSALKGDNPGTVITPE